MNHRRLYGHGWLTIVLSIFLGMSPLLAGAAQQETQASTVSDAQRESSANMDVTPPDGDWGPAAPIPASLEPGKPKAPPSKDAKKYDVSKIGNRRVGSGVNFYSLTREQEMGRELAAQIEQNSRVVDDPVVIRFVNRLGQQLVRHSDAKVPFTIKVLDNEEVNAFALPGGYLFVNTGMILATNSEAELAGVMAHEIAHVAARHGTKNETKAQMMSMATLALGMVGGPAAAIVRQVAEIAMPMTYLKFSRNAEREADLLGLEYEYAAGYDPGALIEFFERLQAQQKKKGFMAKSFQTHPMKQDRVKSAQVAIDNLLPGREQYIISTSAFEEVQTRVAELTRGRRLVKTDRQQGPVLRRDRTQDSNLQPESER